MIKLKNAKMSLRLHVVFGLLVFNSFVLIGSFSAQGVLSSPLFQENFGELSNGTNLSTSNTAFSNVRLGTSTIENGLLNQAIAISPSSFAASAGYIGAKGTSVTSLDKTGLTSFSSGTYTIKFKTPASLTSAILVSAVGTGSSFGSGSVITGAHLSAAFQVTGTNLQIRANGAWTTVQTVSASTAYTVTLVFNNTGGILTYGDATTLPSNKCHVWVDGTYKNEYSAATSSLAASAFRVYTTTGEFEIDDIAVNNSLPTSATQPTIYVAGALAAFTSIVGNSSAEKSFSISAVNLTENLLITPPEMFKVSTTSGASFGSSVSLTHFSGVVSSSIIYVRYSPTEAATHTGNIACSSNGATAANVSVSGTATAAKAEPSEQPTNPNAELGTPSYSSIILNWTNGLGDVVADGYLVKASVFSFDNISNPVDGVEVADGSFTKNVSAGASTISMNGLSDNTTYYFKIFPYTNAGESINYKLSGTIAQISKTTSENTFVENFETGSKGSYAMGNVSCSMGEWVLDSAMFGTVLADMKNGIQSVRMINTKSVYMNFSKPNGADVVSVYAANYSGNLGNRFKLQYSTNDGVSWSDIGSEIATTAILTKYDFNVKKTGNIRVKILKTAGTASRMNIDDITITNFIATTFTGVSSNLWSNAANWDNGLPSGSVNAIIPSSKTVVVDMSCSCNELVIESAASVTINSAQTLAAAKLYIKSDALATGSLINNGTITLSGTAIAERYLTANRWYMFAAPLANQTVADFLTANPSIPTKDTETRAIMDYNTALNNWNDCVTNSNTAVFGNLTASKGVALRSSSNAVFTSTGTVVSGSINVPTVFAGENWNLIGNPYTSAVAINFNTGSPSRFIDGNKNNFDPSYAAIYLWNETNSPSQYTVITNGSASFYAQSGQAFFVKTKAALDFSFTAAMQSHQNSDSFKAQKSSWMGFDLKVVNGDKQTKASLHFREDMTNGLDVSYDAGALKLDKTFSVYTRLIEDNGVDFAVQCLPNFGYDKMIIPIGFDCESGGNVVFTAESVNIPVGMEAILEDRATGTFTALDVPNAKYEIAVAPNSSGIGRFYLYTSSKLVSAKNINHANTITAFLSNNQLHILGEVSNNATAKLFDLSGRVVASFRLHNGDDNQLNIAKLNRGIYTLQIIDGNRNQNIRIVSK